MSAWRTRAYEAFGFHSGSYSHARGKVDLLADLLVLASQAVRDGDEATLDRVLAYVRWAADQKRADGLQSALDLAFFLPAFRDPDLRVLLETRLSEPLFTLKWQMLKEEPD